MCKFSEENSTSCLGIFDESVKQFKPDPTHKVPHMGWNSLVKTTDWLDTSLKDQFVYFVHSFYVPVNPFTSAITDYTEPFSSAMRKGNFYAVQFHPEKSAKTGEMVLKNFLNKA